MFSPFAIVAMISEPKRAPAPASAAEEAHPADDGGGDRVEQERSASDVQVHRLQASGENRPADVGHARRNDEDQDPDTCDVDACPACSLRVPADGVDVAAKGRALRQEISWMRNTRSRIAASGRPNGCVHENGQRRPLRACLWPRRVRTDRHDAECRHRNADDPCERGQRVDLQALLHRRWPSSPAQRNERIQPGDDRGDDPADRGGE